MIYRYFSIVLASLLLVTGLQLPGVVSQYEQRVSAHLAEVSHNLSGFQRIADQFHGGSLAALIEKHRQSTDDTFRAEAMVLEDMYNRRARFQAELNAMEASLAGRLGHVIFASDPELFQETLDSYTWTINLSEEAAICGAALLITGIVLSDLLKLLVGSLFRSRKPVHSRP